MSQLAWHSMRWEVAATAHLDEQARAALESEVVERWAPFVDGGATGVEPGLLLTTGRS